MEVVVITDSCCDLPIEWIKENKVEVMPIKVNINGVEVNDDLGQSLSYKEFYNKIRNAEKASTSQVNSYEFEAVFEKYIKQGKKVIYLGFSSGLSGCINSAILARESLKEKYDDLDIEIIDSKCASLGLGAMVYYLVNILNENKDCKEAVNWIENNKLKLNHWFTVDDLNHLKRGGRLSAAKAIVGTMLNVKPIMNVDDDGKLQPVEKTKGRKKSLKVLKDKLKSKIIDSEKQTIFISHGDAQEEAEYLKELILSEVKVKDVVINNIGPAVGTHSGPGTIALFFLGEKRN
ncbi:DegV family protein [Clostridium sp.]|uniref:DegV family protein n=1 Tax=Clostridium sp. TaxID=1506 RepID=UPI003F3D4A63